MTGGTVTPRPVPRWIYNSYTGVQRTIADLLVREQKWVIVDEEKPEVEARC